MRNLPQAGPPDVVDRHCWRSGIAPPRAVDPTTRERLQHSVRALGEEVEADRAELERRVMAYDDPARVKGRVEETLRSRVLLREVSENYK